MFYWVGLIFSLVSVLKQKELSDATSLLTPDILKFQGVFCKLSTQTTGIWAPAHYNRVNFPILIY